MGMSQHDLNGEAKRMYAATMDYVQTKRKVYEDKVQVGLETIQSRIHDLRQAAQDGGHEQPHRENLKERAQQLEQRYQQLLDKLDAYQQAPARKGGDEKRALEDAALRLRDQLAEVARQ